MKQIEPKLTLGTPTARLALVLIVMGCVWASAAAPASAAPTFEQLGVFAGSATPLTKEQIEHDEEIQLGGVGGMAVNVAGTPGPEGVRRALSTRR